MILLLIIIPITVKNGHDIFVAISHGQNRGILKKVKDERENFINKLIKNLTNKICSICINSFEPVWGSNYYHYLSRSKMALNLSRGNYQENTL